jgi:hypothetical protein
VKFKKIELVAGVALALLSGGFLSVGSGWAGFGLQIAQAQNLGQRTVTGTVVDASASPVAGATVFLKNLKTKSIRSYTSTNDGKFRFAQISMVEDHELWAVKDGKKSAVKTVSSWDTRKEFDSELKLK